MLSSYVLRPLFDAIINRLIHVDDITSSVKKSISLNPEVIPHQTGGDGFGVSKKSTDEITANDIATSQANSYVP